MLPLADLFVEVFVPIDDAICSRAVQIPRRPGPPRPAPTPRCRRSRWSVTCSVGPAMPASWPRSPATGPTCSRTCRPQANSTARSAGCGAPSSCCASTWPPGSRPTPGSRSTPAPIPLKHPSRVRGPDGWLGPAGLHAGPYWTAVARTQRGPSSAELDPRVAGRANRECFAGPEAAEFVCWVRPTPRRPPALVARLPGRSGSPSATLGSLA